MPGGVLVVVGHSGTRHEIPFGVADLATGRRPAATDMFQIASISKSFVALLLLTLAEAARLDLDEPVVRWLPWLDIGPWTDEVTLRHLLSHTAGLVMGGEGLPDAAALTWDLRNRASVPPGRHFHYSNHGYLLLGEVMAAVTGRPLAEYLRERIFRPLDIETDAAAQVTNADRCRFAPGYWPRHADRPWLPGDPLAPAAWVEMDGADGCVALTARGMARYLRLLLGDGTVDGREVVSRSVLGAIGEPTAPEGEDVLVPDGYPRVTLSRYGLGLNHEMVDGRRCLTHGGGNLGYASFLIVDPQLDLGIGVLTNANGDCLAAQHLARVAHQVLAGAQCPAYDDLPRVDPRVRAGELPAGALGGFRSDGLVLEVDESADGVELGLNGEKARLWRTLLGRFVTDHPRLRAFHLDASDDGWSGGPYRFHPSGPGSTVERTASSELEAYVGHYRSWTPWFPEFRVVQREGALWMCAPGGVEAPADDQQLVPVAAGLLRIGAPDWLPERLVEVARVNGAVVLLDRDGARYSRTFTA
jgi:CubicO group peptidase (beta-lactamase class C family)